MLNKPYWAVNGRNKMNDKVNILGVKVDKVNVDEAVDRVFGMLDEC